MLAADLQAIGARRAPALSSSWLLADGSSCPWSPASGARFAAGVAADQSLVTIVRYITILDDWHSRHYDSIAANLWDPERSADRVSPETGRARAVSGEGA